MLKYLLTSKLSFRLFQKSIACFSQQSVLKEQEYLSDGEPDVESKALLNKFEIYQHFVNAFTTKDVIQVYNENKLTYEQIHFAAIKLLNIVIHKQDQQDPLLYEFIKENMISNFHKLNPEQCIAIIQLFQKLSNKTLNKQIKRHIDQNLKNYTHLQLSQIFSFYSKQGWKMVHIGKLLKHHLQTQTFTANSLYLIIKGCYIEQFNLKQAYHSDLVSLACQQLNNLLENINFNTLIYLFIQLAKMQLDQNTTQKILPEFMYKLSEYFCVNFEKISQNDKLQLLEAYSDLPDKFPNELFQKLYLSLQNDNLNNSNQLKLYIYLKIQKEINQPQLEVLQTILKKVNFEDNIETDILIEFLDVEFEEQNLNIINFCISNLIKNKNNLSTKQESDFIDVVIKQKKLDQILDLNKIDIKIIQQLYNCHQKFDSFKSTQQQENIKASLDFFFEKLGKLNYDQKLKIASLILTLDPYKEDPFYEFIDRHINLDSLPEPYFYNFILRLNSKSHYNQELRKKSEEMLPTFNQLEWILNNLKDISFLNDKLVKQIAKWFLSQTDKSIIDDSFNINASLNLLFTFVLNCPRHSLHNMRGTVLQPIRELVDLLAKQVYQSQQDIQINIGQLILFNEILKQLDIRTNLINNICQKLSVSNNNLDDLQKLQVAAIITEIDIYQFQNITVINNFLNLAVQVEIDTYQSILMKTKIYMYQMLNQGKLNQKPDEVSLKLMIDSLKQEIIKYDLNKTQNHYLDGLMTLLEYDGWRFNNLRYEDDGLKDFIETYFNKIDHLMTLNNMRPGLKSILKSIGQFDLKFQFIKNYENLFKNMFQKCHNLKNHEIPSISICLDYIEFAKKVKLSNDDTINVLTDYIKKQIDILKQVQIVEIIQHFSDQKVYFEPLFDALSKQIMKKLQYYSQFELTDIINSFAKLGYFNESLILNILDKFQNEQRFSVNLIQYVQILWSALINLQYFKKQLNKSYQYRYEKLITKLLNEVSKFPKQTLNYKMPVIFRQFMDIYNLLEFSQHLDLQITEKQQALGQQIIENAQKLVTTKYIPNQKLTQQSKNLMQFLDKYQIEYKVNYFLDNQYVDLYIQSRNQIISVDNSLYVTYDIAQFKISLRFQNIYIKFYLSFF